jgi:hypothetical protein
MLRNTPRRGEAARRGDVVELRHAGLLDLLHADPAPARLHGGVVDAGRPGAHHVARAHGGLQRGRVVAVAMVLHRVQVTEVAEEFVEAFARTPSARQPSRSGDQQLQPGSSAESSSTF